MSKSSVLRSDSVFTVKGIAKIAVLGAVSAVLMMFDFPLPFAPSFYKLDFSETAVLIGGFALGPMAAVAIEALKVFLNFLLKGSLTMGVGEIANFLIGCAFVVPASIVYRKNKTRKSAIYGMALGTAAMTVMGVALNYYLLIPAYVALAGFPMDAIIGMGAKINSGIHDVLSLVLICVTPFNLFKGVVVSTITLLLYKHVSYLLHR